MLVGALNIGVVVEYNFCLLVLFSLYAAFVLFLIEEKN